MQSRRVMGHSNFRLLLALIPLLGLSSAHAQPAAGEDPALQTGSNAIDWGARMFPLQTLNRALPGWLQFGGEYRVRGESEDGIGYSPINDTYLLSRFRFNTKIQPSKWVTFFGELQDSRIFFNHHNPNRPPFQNSWDIHQAYVQLGNSTEGWADLTVGRQILLFGAERVIGPSDWLNVNRTFDAVRLNIHHTGYKVSLFASSVVFSTDGVMDHHMQGNNLYGVYGSFKNIIPRATVEPYVLWRMAPANAGLSEAPTGGHLNDVTTGLRIAGALPAAFDYEIEMDRQTGSLGDKSIHAWAGYWSLGRTFERIASAPRVYVEYNYASGTKDPASSTWGTFDEIYPSNHDKLGFADQFGRRNIQQVRAGVEETLGKKWKLRQAYESFWLATTSDALYANSGAISIRANPKATSRHIGQEVDFIAHYQANEGIAFGFGYARLFSGQFLKTASPGKDFSYPFAYLDYRF